MAGGDGSIIRVSRKASSEVVVTGDEVATDGLVMAEFDAFFYIYLSPQLPSNNLSIK